MHLSTAILFFLGFLVTVCQALDQQGVNRSMLYVNPGGNDSNAVPGSVEKPYGTIGAARAAAKDNLIYVFPGQYTNNTLLAASRVNYFMLPGVTVNYTGDKLVSLIDDTAFANGINLTIDGMADFANRSTYYYDGDNHPGLILITNPLSKLDIRCRNMVMRNSETATIDIRNCSSVNIDAQTMVGGEHATGVYWQDGSGIHVRAKEIRVGSYALWEDSSEGNVVQDMYADIDYIETGDEGGLYVSGKSTNSALWVKSKVMRFNSVTGVHLTGVSKLYASAQKFWITRTNGALFYVGNTGKFWADGNKATSAGAPFLLTTAGTVDLTIQQYEESGGMVEIGFDLNGGNSFIHGGRMDVRGTCVQNLSGKHLLSNMILDSSRGSKSPVVVGGAGLTLKNCVLIAAKGVASVSASDSQTVRILGTLTVNTKPSPNVKFVGGELVVDEMIGQ